MSEEIPRAFWPRRGPIASLMCGLLALTVIPVVVSEQQKSWTPLQQFYLSSYIRSAILLGRQDFQAVYMGGAGVLQFALDPWVRAIPRGVKLPAGLPPFLLTVDGRRHSGQWLQIVKLKHIDSAAFNRSLRQWIYEGRSLGSLFRLSI